MTYITAHYIDRKTRYPATELPPRNGAVLPSDAITVDAVDRRQQPPLIVGWLPDGEPVPSAAAVVTAEQHAAILADLAAWRAERDAANLQDERARMKVTRRQAKQQLAAAGVLPTVQPAIDAIEDATAREMIQIYWDDSLHLERMHPELIALGSALGLSDEQMDDLFRAAAER